MRHVLAFILCFGLMSCSTRGSVSIEELNISIGELQKIVVDALPLGKRAQSVNEREYFSEYFLERSGEYESARDSKTRRYAHILILGDRRPYKIEVSVIIEGRNNSGQYLTINQDEGLARVITRRIQNALHKRRDDRNIIDDFRVF